MTEKDFKQYTGTKTVKAVPMTKGEAEKVLDRKIDTSAVEKPDEQPGYLVEYEDGYQSWSPKEVFDKAYKPSGTYLDRMRIEHEEYRQRLAKLSDFTCTQEYRRLNEAERKRMGEQLNIMYGLIRVLGARIDYAESIAED